MTTSRSRTVHRALGAIAVAGAMTASGCAFLVDFDYEEAGQGGGSTSSGVSASGAGGGSAACVSQCTECLASSDVGNGTGACPVFEPLPSGDVGYDAAWEGLASPRLTDVVSIAPDEAVVVGTYAAPLVTDPEVASLPASDTGAQRGFVVQHRGAQKLAKLLVPCGLNQANEYVDGFGPVHVAAVDRYQVNANTTALVVAGAFLGHALAVVSPTDANPPANPCASPQVFLPTANVDESGPAMTPFLVWLRDDTLGYEASEVMAVVPGQEISYFADVVGLSGGMWGPGFAVALGVSPARVSSARLPTGVNPNGVDKGPGYFLFAVDPFTGSQPNVNTAAATAIGVDAVPAGPCGGVDDSGLPRGIHAAALVAPKSWTAGAMPGSDPSQAAIGFGVTNADGACSSKEPGVIVGRAALQWDVLGAKVSFGAPTSQRITPSVPSSGEGGQGSTESPGAIRLRSVAKDDDSTVYFAGSYSGRLGYPGEPEGDATDDGFILAMSVVDPGAPSPQWIQRIEGDGGAVELGGIAVSTDSAGPRLRVVASVPAKGSIGPASLAASPSWCFADEARRPLLASLDTDMGAVVAARLLGGGAGDAAWTLTPTALGAAGSRVHVAFEAPGPFSFDCSGNAAAHSAHRSLHLRTLSYP
jgi:hypothetical protein